MYIARGGTWRRCWQAEAVISDDQVIEVLLTALPSLQGEWSSTECGPVMDAGQIAHHLVKLISIGGFEQELANVFSAVENILLQLPPGTSDAALDTGLLEGIQNICSHDDRPVGSSAFVPYLGEQTLEVWQRLHEGWGTVDT
jgi:hypothetical protein